MRWRKNAWGWTTTDAKGVRWTIRGPIFGFLLGKPPMFWVYRNGVRFNHGTVENPNPLTSVEAARAACEAASKGETS